MPVIDLGSVVGPTGPQGVAGSPGVQGIQGNPGPNQVTDQTSTNLNGVLFGNQSRVAVKPVDSTPTADSTNLVSSGGVKTALDTKANQTQLAYVETGTTASRAYAVGEYFCLNGLLYRAKTAISSGGTFTPGTNCEQVTGGGFNALKAQTLVRRQSIATSITSGLNEWDVAADAVSGYKPIGVVGVQFAALPRSAVTLSQFVLDGTNISVSAQSTLERTSGIAVNAFVLYAKE